MRKSSLIFVAIAFAVIASALLLMRNGQANKTDQGALTQDQRERRALAEVEGRSRRRIEALPEVVNETPSLQITNMEIVTDESSDLLRLTLRNYSEKAINSFTICSHVDDLGSTGVTFLAPPGQALIEPHGEISKEVAGESIKRGKPLTVCALMFVNETEEGLPSVRQSVKESYEERKQQTRKEKL